MKSSVLRLAVTAVILILTAAPGAGSPSDGRGVVPLDLTAGGPEFETAGDRLHVVPRIAGFGLTSRAGEPRLPLRIVLVAIPEGSDPELEVLSASSRTIPGIEIAPVPRLRVRERLGEGQAGARGKPGAPSPLDDDFAPDRLIYGRDAEFPASPLRLGAIGYLREQRYVEVLFTPVLYNPARHEARFFEEVQARVRFTLPQAPAGAGAGGAFRPDPFFEETYRRSLVNYEQGKLFRVVRGGAAPSATAASSPISAGDSASSRSSLGVEAAGVPRYKLSVSKQGIYRLDSGYLAANAPDLLAADPRTLMIRAEGVEIPISIRTTSGGSGEADGRFDPGDFLEFFGRPKSEPPTALNYDFGTTFPDIYQANDFTDTQVYWLSAEGTAGSHLRIPAVDGTPINAGFPVAADFDDAAVWDENNIYLPLGDADPFFSIPSLLAGSTQVQRDLSLTIPGLAPSSALSTITIRLRGGSDLSVSPDHRTVAWLNTDTADTTDFTWDGEVIREQQLTVPQSVLTAATTIHLSAPGLAGVTLDRQYPDKVTIHYRRLFASTGDLLAFNYPNQDSRFQITGFSGAGATIYDVSRALPGGAEADPALITAATASGAPTVTYTFDVPHDASAGAPATRSFVVAGPAGLRLPDAIVRAADPVLKNPQSAADFLVIASRDTIDPSPGGALDNLLAHRLSAQGLTSRVVYVDQIYDEFSYGLRDVNALRAFLAYAFDNWKGSDGLAPPPAFVLLVGDATPDYKNTLGRSDWIDQVPTPMMFQVSSILGYYSSDNWIASFRGADQVPDVYLGRISTRSAATSAMVFDKIRLYEESPAAGLWKGHAILAAGDGKFPGEAASFEAVQSEAASSFFSTTPYSVPSPPLYFDNAPWYATDAAGFKNALIGEINGGAAIFSYVGHGAFDIWGNNTFFTTDDATRLTNGGLLPFLINVNCLSGGFHYLQASGSLAEGMVNNPLGGAIAAFAPSGLSNVLLGQTLSDQILSPLFGPKRERILGVASQGARAELWSQGSIIDLQSYTFLGDPATLLATPAPPPPTGLAAQAGNGQVTLSWTAPAQPVSGYRIFRAASSPTGAYAAVPCGAVGGTSCIDHGVLNATTYYYYAVSVDGEGFGGRASNFNSDCGGAGVDCVSATPVNPNPPSPPTGLVAGDPGSGGRLDVSWNPNPETDIKSYTLRYGTVPGGPYTAAYLAAASVSSVTLTGLTDGFRYYMALSATNTSGHESALSAETSNVPHLIQGIAPPRAISDLMVSRSANDLLLTWSRPIVDIYGRPTTVVKYTVYRGTAPAFQPFASPPLATITDASITAYTDAGAALLTSGLYYLVTATDSNGLVSGAGRELPNGIPSLGLSVPAAGTVRLSWSAVTTDMQGLPTIVDHYQVHMGSQPLSRASLGSSTLFMDNVRTLSVDLSAPGSPLFFSVIAVDDRGNLSPF